MHVVTGCKLHYFVYYVFERPGHADWRLEKEVLGGSSWCIGITAWAIWALSEKNVCSRSFFGRTVTFALGEISNEINCRYLSGQSFFVERDPQAVTVDCYMSGPSLLDAHQQQISHLLWLMLKGGQRHRQFRKAKAFLISSVRMWTWKKRKKKKNSRHKEILQKWNTLV